MTIPISCEKSIYVHYIEICSVQNSTNYFANYSSRCSHKFEGSNDVTIFLGPLFYRLFVQII